MLVKVGPENPYHMTFFILTLQPLSTNHLGTTPNFTRHQGHDIGLSMLYVLFHVTHQFSEHMYISYFTEWIKPYAANYQPGYTYIEGIVIWLSSRRPFNCHDMSGGSGIFRAVAIPQTQEIDKKNNSSRWSYSLCGIRHQPLDDNIIWTYHGNIYTP